MSALAVEHLFPVLFFAVLIAFESVRRRISLLRHPMFAYLVRGALAAVYFGVVGIDPFRWLASPGSDWLGASAAAVVAIAAFRRHDVLFLLRSGGAMVVQAAYLAAFVAFIEELIFRGAFVLVAAATLETTVLASVGASIAYVVWRAITYRDRDAASLATVFVASLACGLLAGLSRSLWPSVIAHGAYVFLAGPPRAPRRRVVAA